MDSRLSWSGLALAVPAALTLVVCSWHPWVVVEGGADIGFSPLSMSICTTRCFVETNFDIDELARRLGEARSGAFPVAGVVALASLWVGVAALVASIVLVLARRLGQRAAWRWVPRLGVAALVALPVASAVLLATAPQPWFIVPSPPHARIQPADAWWLVLVASIAGAIASLLLALHETRVRAALRGTVPAARVVGGERRT